MTDEECFVVGPDGIARWGRYGAAGLLLRHTDAEGVRWFLLAQRSAFVQHPLTWAYPGGALRRGERPEAGAVREFREEFGPATAYTVADVIVERPAGAGGWCYWTVLADVDQLSDPKPLTAENIGRAQWFRPAEMETLDLHPALRGKVGDDCRFRRNQSPVSSSVLGVGSSSR